MPWSPSQHRLFEAAAHDPAIAKRKGIKRSDARRMAGEGIKGALELAGGGEVAPDVPSYQINPQGQQGVQLLPWNQLDPFTYNPQPVPHMAEGGSPGGLEGMLGFLSRMKRTPGGGPGTQAPITRGGVMPTISSDVPTSAETGSSDPRFAAMDPRSRALAKINERLKQQSSIEGAQGATESIMARRLSPGPTLDMLAPSGFRSQLGLADGGGVRKSLVELLRKMPRSERFDALRENRMRPLNDENEMFARLGSPESSLNLYGPFPDWKLKGQNMMMVPRNRQRFKLFDTMRKNDEGYATEAGSLAANWKGNKAGDWLPQDMIDLDIAKPMQRQGYGHDALALMLSNMKGENERFPLYDVKNLKAKKYWDSIGAQMQDPSQPFHAKHEAYLMRTPDGDYVKNPLKRNNDYYITPGDYLDNVDKFASGGRVIWDDEDLHERLVVPPRYADGGEVGMDGGDALMLAAGLAASRLRPRHINKLARPFSRALAKPVLGMEAVSSTPLPGRISDARYDFARSMVPHKYADLPVHKGQGAWQGENGMEYNPLYMQELPRRAGRLRDDPDAMYYAGQMGENLEQAATPINRFVPHLMNTPEDANAMMVPNVNSVRLRQLARDAGPDWVTAHRPGNRAMMFPIGDEPLEPMAQKLGVDPRYGRSDIDTDRVLLSRKPLGYESGTYAEVGAQPRNASYDAREGQTLASGSRMVEVFDRMTRPAGAK